MNVHNLLAYLRGTKQKACNFVSHFFLLYSMNRLKISFFSKFAKKVELSKDSNISSESTKSFRRGWRVCIALSLLPISNFHWDLILTSNHLKKCPQYEKARVVVSAVVISSCILHSPTSCRYAAIVFSPWKWTMAAATTNTWKNWWLWN